jgi:diaminopimelate decarboxylase
VAALAELTGRLRSDGHPVELVDVGGGWGVPYRPGEAPLELEALAEGVRERLPGDVRLAVEPGRFLVAESTVLLTRVTAVQPPFVGVDAGMHTLLRPSLYDAYHHVSSLEDRDGPERTVHVVGPVCETADVLARDRPLPDPRRGDLLAFHTAGAYGHVMASRYNGRPLPGEVLVDGGEERTIRRPEDREELFRQVPGV